MNIHQASIIIYIKHLLGLSQYPHIYRGIHPCRDQWALGNRAMFMQWNWVCGYPWRGFWWEGAWTLWLLENATSINILCTWNYIVNGNSDIFQIYPPHHQSVISTNVSHQSLITTKNVSHQSLITIHRTNLQNHRERHSHWTWRHREIPYCKFREIVTVWFLIKLCTHVFVLMFCLILWF